MTMSRILKDYLTQHGIDYEVHAHPRTFDSAHTAEASHVPGDRLAKAVMLEDEQGYLMAVLPGDCACLDGIKIEVFFKADKLILPTV